jgi:hypothetical protein
MLTGPPDERGPKDLRQVWFPGVHCDVGGGYLEKESGLSKLALDWMIREAIAVGLLVDPAQVTKVLGGDAGGYAKPDANADMHESLKSLWWLAEFLVGLAARRQLQRATAGRCGAGGLKRTPPQGDGGSFPHGVPLR